MGWLQVAELGQRWERIGGQATHEGRGQANRYYLHDTGKSLLYGTAWWGWEDSSFQPSGYEPRHRGLGGLELATDYQPLAVIPRTETIADRDPRSSVRAIIAREGRAS